MVIGKIYNFVDDGIMYGVNKAVYAWNWTTGRPKEDLANLLWVTGNYFMVDGVASASSMPAGAKYSIFGVSSISGYGLNTFIAESEQKSAREMGAEDIKTQRSKRDYSFLGPVFMACSIGVQLEPPNEKLDFTFGERTSASFGLSLMGASLYVMRADTLKPRKDFVSRFIESLYREPATVDAE